MKVVCIIQARMTSTRLPGKVLKKVLRKTLLEYQLERVKYSKLIDEIIVATTTNDSDIPIIELCNQLGITFFRGSEDDVLERYYQAALENNGDVIVRLTSDCPLIDPKIIDKNIEMYLYGNYDYVSNTQERTYPRGMDTEVFSFELLKKADLNSLLDYEREHVTPYFYTNNKKFLIGQVKNQEDYSNYRLTVDTVEDLELITVILENLYPKNGKFKLDNIIKFLKENPELATLNQHIEQKKLGE